MEVIAYRTNKAFVGVAVRAFNASQAAWGSNATLTTMPNDYSNLNAGRLPDGRTYFLNNPVTPLTGNGRDPVTLAWAKDGLTFANAGVIMTCSDLGPSSNCTSRFELKTPGPSYPQAVALTDPAPKELQALYVAATNNKEDVWVVRIEFDKI